jgi:hypothetical protein
VALVAGGTALAALASCSLTSCSLTEKPCSGFGVGSRLEVTVVDSYTGNTKYDQSQATGGWTCNFGFDIVQGQKLEMTVVANQDDDGICYQAIPSVESFGGWTWKLNMAGLNGNTGNGSEARALYDVSDGACQGEVWMDLRSGTSGDITGLPEPGKVPPAILERKFEANSKETSDGGTPPCPQTCNGDFAVIVKRL